MSTLKVTNIQATGETASRAVSGVAAAWCDFNGTGTLSIRDSLNISSITDNGTGNYALNYSSSFSTANYAVLCSGVSEYNHSRGPTFQLQVAVDGSQDLISKATSNTTLYSGIGASSSANGSSYDHKGNYVASLGDLA